MADETTKNGSSEVDQALEAIKKAKPAIIDGICLPMRLPGLPPWEEKVQQQRNLKLRDDDVFLLTYPKAGTHWMWEMMTMLRKGKAEHDKFTKVQTMIEFVTNDVLDKLPSPRILDSHVPFSMLPVPEMKARRLKAVHVYRNPKDSCVSMYHMAMSSAPMRLSMPEVKDFADFFNYFFYNDKMQFGSYFRYLKQMHEFQKNNPEVPFLNLSYEDVKKDPAGNVKKIAKFLELNVSDELCVQIAEECSFDKMKKQEANKSQIQFSADQPSQDTSLKMVAKHSPTIFRKGQIGDWKNCFTVAMNEKADELIAKEMKDLPFTLTFE